MKKSSFIFLGILFISFNFFISCSENDSSSNNKELSYMREGPDECNQDEYEDEAETETISAEVDEECEKRNVANVPTKRDILYSIRDNILLKYPKGIKYVDEYYLTSKVEKDYSKFTVGNFVDVIELMPYIYDAHDKFNKADYTGVIISSTLKSKLVNVLVAYKKLSNDAKYNSIIDSFINDVYTITNKNKSAVISFMNN